jgi:hypothetical protein
LHGRTIDPDGGVVWDALELQARQSARRVYGCARLCWRRRRTRLRGRYT